MVDLPLVGKLDFSIDRVGVGVYPRHRPCLAIAYPTSFRRQAAGCFLLAEILARDGLAIQVPHACDASLGRIALCIDFFQQALDGQRRLKSPLPLLFTFRVLVLVQPPGCAVALDQTHVGRLGGHTNGIGNADHVHMVHGVLPL
ncbi:hypothetical protein D3C85_1279450 [compost metagenome]